MLTIAKIRRAADTLRTENHDVSFPRLASKLGCGIETLRRFVDGRRGLENELGVVADHWFPGLVFAHAADCIRQLGELVTRMSLAINAG